MNVIVQRDAREQVLTIRPETIRVEDGTSVGRIGAEVLQVSLSEILPPDMQREIRYGPIAAIQPPFQETWDKSVFVLDSVKKMIIGLISVKNISVPITIAQVPGETAT